MFQKTKSSHPEATSNARTTHSRVRCGFTLIELLVVIAIISLLMAILLPSLSKAKQLAQSVMCLANLRAMGSTMHLYAADNNGGVLGRFTDEAGYWNVRLVRDGYIDQTSDLFYCPSFTPHNYETLRVDPYFESHLNPATGMVAGYGMRVWVNPGEPLQTRYTYQDHALDVIYMPSAFFLMVDSVYIGAHFPRFHMKQFYGVSPNNVTQRVRIQHSAGANAVFADGSARPEDTEYFEQTVIDGWQATHSASQPYLTWTLDDQQ